MQRKQTVLIADDHGLMARGIGDLLSRDYEIIGTVSDGEQLIRAATLRRPDLIVSDVGMPGMSGIEAARKLRETGLDAKIVIVSQQSEPQYIRAAFRAGAAAYVSKQSPSEELMAALRAVSQGDLYIDSSLHGKLDYEPLAMIQRSRIAGDKLTQRQREVLRCIATGKTAVETAKTLKISPKTVEFHKKALIDSTGLRTIADLVRYAISRGEITLQE